MPSLRAPRACPHARGGMAPGSTLNDDFLDLLTALREADLERPDMVLQVGIPPGRIDVLTGLSGVAFADAWEGRTVVTVGSLAVPFLGRETLVRNKRAAGRLKDLADIEALGEEP